MALSFPTYAIQYLRENHEHSFPGGTRVPTLRWALGSLYKWGGTHYTEWDPKVFHAHLTKWLADKQMPLTRHYRETETHVLSSLILAAPAELPSWIGPRDRNTRTWLAFTNGILDLTTLLQTGKPTLLPHTPEWFSTTVLPYAYSAEADCPTFKRCLGEWFPDDPSIAPFLQEFAGYLLVPETYLHAGLFLEGVGRNGKSTFLKAMQGMIGRTNYSTLALDGFKGEYALDSTIGKLANFASETDPGARIPLATLKAYIAGDDMTTNRKYQKHVTFTPTARLVVAWNERPVIKDTSDGFWERIKLIAFKRQFLGSAADTSLDDKLRLELPGILNWAVEGYRRLKERGRLPECPSVKRAGENFRSQSDPVRSYIMEHWARGDGEPLTKNMVYNHYLQHRLDQETEPLTEERFFKELYRCLPGVEAARHRIGKADVRVPVLTGLCLKEQQPWR